MVSDTCSPLFGITSSQGNWVYIFNAIQNIGRTIQVKERDTCSPSMPHSVINLSIISNILWYLHGRTIRVKRYEYYLM